MLVLVASIYELSEHRDAAFNVLMYIPRKLATSLKSASMAQFSSFLRRIAGGDSALEGDDMDDELAMREVLDEGFQVASDADRKRPKHLSVRMTKGHTIISEDVHCGDGEGKEEEEEGDEEGRDCATASLDSTSGAAIPQLGSVEYGTGPAAAGADFGGEVGGVPDRLPRTFTATKRMHVDTGHFVFFSTCRVTLPMSLILLWLGGVFLSIRARDADAIDSIHRMDLAMVVGADATAAQSHLTHALITRNTTYRNEVDRVELARHLDHMLELLNNLIHGTDEGFLGSKELPPMHAGHPEYNLATAPVCDTVASAITESRTVAGGGLPDVDVVGNCSSFDGGHFQWGLRGGIFRFVQLSNLAIQAVPVNLPSNLTGIEYLRASNDTEVLELLPMVALYEAGYIRPLSLALASILTTDVAENIDAERGKGVGLVGVRVWVKCLPSSVRCACRYLVSLPFPHVADNSDLLTGLCVAAFTVLSFVILFPFTIRLGGTLLASRVLLTAIPDDIAFAVPGVGAALQKITRELARAARSVTSKDTVDVVSALIASETQPRRSRRGSL
jgi:hypothetical protein